MTDASATQKPVSVSEFFDALRASGILRGDTWGPWRAFLCALFGLPLTRSEARVYRACTARKRLPTKPFNEGWIVAGRRSGKSFVLALVAVFLGCFRGHTGRLGPGERATVMIIATD